MKKLVEVVEVEGQGLESLLGQQVLLLCANYFYTGKLSGVNETFVRLEDASVVYETGPWTSTSYKDAQRLPVKEWNIERAAIESWGAVKG